MSAGMPAASPARSKFLNKQTKSLRCGSRQVRANNGPEHLQQDVPTEGRYWDPFDGATIRGSTPNVKEGAARPLQQNRHGAAVSLHLERVRKRPAATIPYERMKPSISDWAQFMESSIDPFCREHLAIILVMIPCA